MRCLHAKSCTVSFPGDKFLQTIHSGEKNRYETPTDDCKLRMKLGLVVDCLPFTVILTSSIVAEKKVKQF